MQRPATFGLMALLTLAAAGCDTDRKPRLTGIVTLDGQPLADAEVQLVITPNNRPTAVAGGWTDEEGKYEIRNVHPRTYKVVVRKYLKPDGSPTKREEMVMIELSGGKGLTPVVPSDYMDPLATSLAVEVKEKRQTADFAIQSGSKQIGH